MITIEQKSLSAEAERSGHCDHKEEESSWAPQRETSPFWWNETGLRFPVSASTDGIQSDMWFVVVSRIPLLKYSLSSWVSTPWCFSWDCLVLSLLKACRRCSSMKTGSLQCCNLMAHAASERQTFHWSRHSLVYATELPEQVESTVPVLLSQLIWWVFLFVFK